MERYFEKISFNQFSKDISGDYQLYDGYKLPCRGSKYSGGYDFFAIEDISLKQGEIVKIPTGYKAKFLDDEVLMLVVRSSMGFKYNIRLCNQIGIVDSDYYNNSSNEGHIWISLQNEGEKNVIIKKGDRYCQGIFIKYLTCGDVVDNSRNGGFGSTNNNCD